SDEVQRATQALGLQSAQLPTIAADLEKIAAALAEAQRSSAWYITALEYDLENIDDEICESLAESDHCAADDLRADAVIETRAIMFVLSDIRGRYSTVLQAALEDLRTDGGDPAEITGVDQLLIPPVISAGSPPSVRRSSS